VESVVDMLKLSKIPDPFLLEVHPKLRPVDTATDGIYIAGCCASPKDITDSIAQGKAAASGFLVYFVLGKAKIEPAICEINEELCIGCGRCEEACPFGALALDEERHVMTVNEAVCKGCGGCNAICPSGVEVAGDAVAAEAGAGTGSETGEGESAEMEVEQVTE
jgi:heterodisulfide reductase subunit A